ncbi:MAG: hypothetical protein K6E45_05440, partial [Bacteroidaceae bacterium]|nr:hypothetical protein [Bacteroidaceae bacterium]
ETDGRVVARSEISAFITKVSDGNGGYVMESGVRISANNIDLTGTDSISLAISNVASNQKQYSPNLLPNSIINETSVAYGFGNRSLKLENGKTYTLSASGIVPTSLPSNMVLEIFIYRLKDSSDTADTSKIGVDWAWSRNLEITANGGAARTNSVTFTTERTGTFYISSYLYDKNQTNGSGSGGTRTYPVTTLWYKVEEGSTATPWVANDNDERHVDNYIMNPLAISATKEVNSDFSSSEVTDNEYGKVLQVSHTVNGHWQLTFTRRSTYAQLTNNHATFYVICKALNGYDGYSNGNRTRLCFGYDNNGTQIMVDTLESSFIDLGNGWRKYYSVNKMDLALGSTVGICHVMGSWQIYAVGIVAGGVCPTMAEIMASNSLLKTGIDLTAGKIELRADKVTFTSSDGTISNKISIDPTTGTLRATDAIISGTINANAGVFGNMEISGETFNGVNGKLRFGSYNTAYTTISTSQAELNSNANIYMLNELSYCLYATTLATGRAAIMAVGSVAIEANGRSNLKGGIVKKVTKVTANYTLTTNDSVIICKSNSFTLTLPTNCSDGQQFTILSETTNTITIQAGSGDSISHSNMQQTGNFLVTGNLALPATIASKDIYNAYDQSTTTYYTKAFGVLLVYDSDAKKWSARFLI